MSEYTKGPWKTEALGGSSTVLVGEKPPRNDTRIPAYAYDETKGHCIAYPFLNDNGSTRLDLVCFSHEDARRIVDCVNALEGIANPSAIGEVVEAARTLAIAESSYRLVHDLKGDGHTETGRAWDHMRRSGDALRAALAKLDNEGEE